MFIHKMTKQTKPLVDVVDHKNNPTGQIATADEVTNNALWHRGCHVTLYSDDGKILVQKRSKKMMQAPSKLTVGAGGFVDAGEQPLEAAIREIDEEIGIQLTDADLRFTGISVLDKKWHFGLIPKRSRTFMYCYIAQIDSATTFDIQKEEVEWVKMVPIWRVNIIIFLQKLHISSLIAPSLWFYDQATKSIEYQLSKRKLLRR